MIYISLKNNLYDVMNNGDSSFDDDYADIIVDYDSFRRSSLLLLNYSEILFYITLKIVIIVSCEFNSIILTYFEDMKILHFSRKFN